MRPVDVVTVGAFFAIVVTGMILSSLRDLRRRMPKRRIHARLQPIQQMRGATQGQEQTAAKPAADVELFNKHKEYSWLEAWFQHHLQRIKTVAGSGGIRLVSASAVFGAIAGLAIAGLAPLPEWTHPFIYLGVPLLAVRLAYRFLIGRFRTQFLGVFPDTLDLIIRAVRAGIPAVHAINTAGDEAEEPVRSIFRTMGDSLRLGADLKDVLDRAVKQVQIADFSFFSVCLLLQRETGGNLTETLENLSGIIRSRRDIRLKTRALTAEGRIASKIIAAVPFAITALLFIVNRPYIDLLFHTRAGHKMLTLASVLLAIGLTVINKIAKLDTSR